MHIEVRTYSRDIVTTLPVFIFLLHNVLKSFIRLIAQQFVINCYSYILSTKIRLEIDAFSHIDNGMICSVGLYVH